MSLTRRDSNPNKQNQKLLCYHYTTSQFSHCKDSVYSRHPQIKYRRKILKGEFDDNIKAIFQSIADNSDFDIDIMETDKDHIHFLISYPPKLSVTSIVRELKQESTVFSWRLYDSMLRKYFWKEKTLWSGGYFVCSIGEANPNTVIEYIRNQE